MRRLSGSGTGAVQRRARRAAVRGECHWLSVVRVCNAHARAGLCAGARARAVDAHQVARLAARRLDAARDCHAVQHGQRARQRAHGGAHAARRQTHGR